MDAETVFRDICSSIKSCTYVGSRADGSLEFELPFQHADGDPVILVVRDGTDGPVISDDGRTMLRLLGDGQLAAFESSPGFGALLRNHCMKRQGPELIFEGARNTDIVHFLEGIRSIETYVPRDIERSTAFNDVVRRTVRKRLDEQVKAGRIEDQMVEHILHPHLTTVVPRGAGKNPITVEVDADFQNRTGDMLFVVLSYADATPGGRMTHIRAKLTNHLLMRWERRAGLPNTTAVVPKGDSGYSDQDLEAIEAYTGHPPWPFDPERDARGFVAMLMADPNGPLATS